jgi:hypothetical protein
VNAPAEGSVEREIARLASERTDLFGRGGQSARLSSAEQSRLRSIERQLDDCFTSLRQLRAARAATRFAREQPFTQRGAKARGTGNP